MNELRTMHLFAGIGGGLLADLILGHRPVVAVEWEPYACRVLRERAAEGWFPGLRVWEGDVRLFDPSEYTGQVDCIHAGFPCQDISVAGKQAGVSEGTRSGLYREVLRIAGVVKPRYLFLENVAAILSNGLGTVLADLASLGYDSRWICLRASDVGAPHHRDRWWLLAYTNGKDGGASSVAENTGTDGRDFTGRLCEVVPNSDELRTAAGTQGEKRCSFPDINRNGTPEERGRYELNAWIGRLCADVPDTSGNRLEGYGGFSFGIGEEYSTFGNSCWWETEPELGRVANGVPNRVGQLKGYGNAQVPLQAATAWKLLGGE